MATSGSTDYTLNSRGVVQAAVELCGVRGLNDAMSAKEAEVGLKHLNLLLKTWGTDPKLFIEAEGTVSPLVLDQANYSLTAARRVTEVRRRKSGNDTPLEPLSRKTYYELPDKAATGPATSFYFDPQRATRTLYIWPVPNAAEVSGTTLRYTYHRVIEDSDALDNDPDVPQEWLEALIYALAARLCLPLSVFARSGGPQRVAEIKERAASLYAQLTADSDEDTSVFLQPA